jgi:hypothetical protein
MKCINQNAITIMQAAVVTKLQLNTTPKNALIGMANMKKIMPSPSSISTTISLVREA